MKFSWKKPYLFFFFSAETLFHESAYSLETEQFSTTQVPITPPPSLQCRRVVYKVPWFSIKLLKNRVLAVKRRRMGKKKKRKSSGPGGKKPGAHSSGKTGSEQREKKVESKELDRAGEETESTGSKEAEQSSKPADPGSEKQGNAIERFVGSIRRQRGYWLPLGCGLLLLLISLLPWASVGEESFSLTALAGNTDVFPVPLTSPKMGGILLYLVPVMGLVFIVGTGAPAFFQPWKPWLLGGLGTLFLLLFNWYNPALTQSSFHPHHNILLGMPLSWMGAAAAGAFAALHIDPEKTRKNWARPVATAAVIVFLLSAFIPEYILGERSIPLVGQLQKLGEGGLSSLAGLISLLTWASAGLLAWELYRFANNSSGTKRISRNPGTKHSNPLYWPALTLLCLHHPIYLLSKGMGSDQGALTYTLLALGATAASLVTGWAAASLFMCSSGDEAKWRKQSFSEAAFWIVATLLLLAFLLMESQGVGYTVTDENIYYYQANLVAQGELPYRDFFFAHPPLHILIPALFFYLFGFNLFLAKMISISAAMIAGIFVLLTARRILGRPAALIALCLYLFSFAVLNAGVNLTGINLTVMFLMAGFYTALCGKPLSAGALTAFALSTGFYSAAAAAAMLLAALLLSPGFGLRFAIGMFGVFGFINLFFYILGGSSFIEGVYLYHGRKPPRDPRHMEYGPSPLKALFYNFYVLLTTDELKKTILYHGHLIWGFLIAIFAWFSIGFGWLARGQGKSWIPETTGSDDAEISSPAGKTKKRSKSFLSGVTAAIEPIRKFFSDILKSPDGGPALVLLVGSALVVQFSMFKRLHSFYFVLWYPFMAIGTAFLLDRIFRTIAAVFREDRGGKETSGKGRNRGKEKRFFSAAVVPKTSTALVTCISLAFLFGCYKSCENWGHHVHESEFQNAGRRLDYPWREPKFLSFAGSTVKTLFWVDHRIQGEVVPSYRQYLWNKKRHFDTAPEIAAHIKKNTTPNETIAGASAVAPLLALLAERRIADNFVDTNTLRFRSGLSTTEEFYERVCNTPIAYIVSAPRSFFTWNKMRHHNRFLEGFSLERTFADPDITYGGTYLIHLLRRTNKKTEAPYCRYLGRTKP